MRLSLSGLPPASATSRRVGWAGVVTVMVVVLLMRCLSHERRRGAMPHGACRVKGTMDTPRYDGPMQHVRQRSDETQSNLLKRIEELAAAGKIKKGTGTVPDHLVFEEPPQLPEPYGVLAQLLEDRERGW